MNERIQAVLDLAEKTLSPKPDGSQEQLELEIRALLADPYANSLIKDVEAALSNQAVRTNAFAAGGLYFYLFSVQAELTHSSNDYSRDSLSYGSANKFLRESNTWYFICEYYGITKKYETIDDLSLHRCGTTSYIIKITTTERLSYALKLIKPQYITNPNIRNANKAYKARYAGKTDNAPQIYVSEEKYLIMTFIDGDTLRELFESKIWPDLAQHDPKFLTNIIKKLFNVLRNLAGNGLTHADLSPDNIIVKRRHDGDKKQDGDVYLIDFGLNYIIQERCASTADVLRAQMYVSPQLLDESNKGRTLRTGIFNDVYSVGVIVLEALVGTRVHSQEIWAQFAMLREKMPLVAKVLEAMLDTRSEKPILESLNLKDEDIHEAVGESICRAIDVQHQVYDRPLTGLQSAIAAAFDLATAGLVVLNKHREACMRMAGAGIINLARFHTLVRWMMVAQGSHFFLCGLFVFMLIRDIQDGSWRQNLTGRIICLSFSHVACRYYINVFGLVDSLRHSRTTHTIQVFNSFGFVIPICIAFIWNPSWWPFCSAVGLFFVTCNNFMHSRLMNRLLLTSGDGIVKIDSRQNDLSRRYPVWAKSSVDALVKVFRYWWVPTLVYVILCVVIGVLLLVKRIGAASLNLPLNDPWVYKTIFLDEWVYVACTVMTNIMMYSRNCTQNAPVVGHGLDYLYRWCTAPVTKYSPPWRK